MAHQSVCLPAPSGHLPGDPLKPLVTCHCPSWGWLWVTSVINDKTIPLKFWSLCNLISNAVKPLQSEESLKAESKVNQENEKDTQAKNCQSTENVPSQVDKMLFQRTIN